MRLMRVHSALGCVGHALLYEDHFEDDPARPSFADVVALARDIVGETVNRLDSVHLGPLMRKGQGRRPP